MIYITGDTHGRLNSDKISPLIFKEGEKLTKSDYLIITGDIGLFYLDSEYILSFKEKKYTTLMVEGNHENYSLIKKLPEVEMFGDYVKQVNDSLYILQRGHIYNIDSYTFFTFGGAKSIDRGRRIEGLDWFPEEETNYQEISFALDNLAKYNNKVDYIITHDCSSFALDDMCNLYNFYPNYTSHNKFFEEIRNTVEFKMWYFGHYHKDLIIKDNKERCLFNEVINLETGKIANSITD